MQAKDKGGRPARLLNDADYRKRIIVVAAIPDGLFTLKGLARLCGITEKALRKDLDLIRTSGEMGASEDDPTGSPLKQVEDADVPTRRRIPAK